MQLWVGINRFSKNRAKCFHHYYRLMIFFLFLFAGLYDSNQLLGSNINENIVIKDYSYIDGLTTNSVNKTYRDSKGFLWLCSLNGLYRYDGYNFRKIESERGLLNGEILDMVEDENQNFLIATAKKGLIYYNTLLEEIFTIPFDIRFSYNVNKILLFDNKVWLGTDSGLIIFDKPHQFDKNTIVHTKVVLPEPNNPSHQKNRITFLYQDTSFNYIWIGTNGGAFALNTRNNILTVINSHPQNAVRVILPFENKLLVGSWDGGVFLVDPVSLSVIQNNSIINWLNQIINHKRVISACYDSLNNLWLATYGDGLYYFNLIQKTYHIFSSRFTSSKTPNIKSDIINHLYYDKKDHILWLSMNQPALTKIYERKNFFNIIEPSSLIKDKSFEISSIRVSNVFKNSVWISTSRNGLILYDVLTNKMSHFTTLSRNLLLPTNEISLVYEDRKGNLWLVLRKMGLYFIPNHMLVKIKNSSFNIKPINANPLASNENGNSYIISFYEDSKNRLWLGYWGGLYLLEFKADFGKPQSLSNINQYCNTYCIFSDENTSNISFAISPVQTVFEVGENELFVGTRDEGIIKVTEIEKNKFVSRLANEINQQLRGENIRGFYKQSKDTIWIGTNVGLAGYNHTSQKVFVFLNENSGLSSENINHTLLDNKNNIWLSTSYGISMVTPKNYHIKNYIFEFGDNQLNHLIYSSYAQLPDGYMVFSTNKNLIVYHPDSLYQPKTPISLYFTKLKINNQTITPLVKIGIRRPINTTINEVQKISLPYGATMQLEFAAIDFLNSEQIKYKYRINNNDWIPLEKNQRILNFYNNNSGLFNLQIMAQHPMGSNIIKSITLEFLPPWYKTWWAYFIYTIILGILFFSYRNLIIQKIRQQTKLEQEHFENKKLQELDRIKSTFISNLAHEIRTPLCLIINPLENIIKNNLNNNKIKENIEITLKNSYRLMKLANELADYTKIDKDLVQPEFRNDDFVETVRDVYLSFKPMADTMHIDYQFYSTDKELILPFDKGMIEKVVFNLLSNAFKYTNQNGSIIVEISIVESQDENFVRLVVVNTGKGIPPEKIDKIFDRFYQVDAAQQGVGIGLSLVKAFVEIHNGFIKVQSTANVETKFEILLPTKQHIVQDGELPNHTVLNSSLELGYDGVSFNEGNEQKSFKLLIVEDDVDILSFIKTQFESIYKVYTETNGKDGYHTANSIVPDIIITDVVMPDMDGIELCKKLRNNLATSHIPIIIISAKASHKNQVEGLEAGANLYLVKPFHMEVLKNQVDRLIQLKENIYKKIVKESDIVPPDIAQNEIDKQFMDKVVDYIHMHISDKNLNVDAIASHLCISNIQLYRKIKAITGLSVVEFILSVRLKTAAKLIQEQKYSFSEIAYETGFSSPSYFTKCFRQYFGKTPSEYASLLKNKIG